LKEKLDFCGPEIFFFGIFLLLKQEA